MYIGREVSWSLECLTTEVAYALSSIFAFFRQFLTELNTIYCAIDSAAVLSIV